MTEDLRNGRYARFGGLARIISTDYAGPSTPTKRINDGDDLAFFLTSKAYADIMTFLLHLNMSMFPRQTIKDGKTRTQAWTTDSAMIELSPSVVKIQELVQKLRALIDEAPADTGPRRYGNKAFKKWYELVEKDIPTLLQEALPESVWKYTKDEKDRSGLVDELGVYLLGSLGSPQRLDYGTGHELSFLAFLGCIWKLGGFATNTRGEEERGLVVGVIEPYIELVRTLIITYTLEPAGSHGVWGLDDHFFLPYIFGSAQLATSVSFGSRTPEYGSLHRSEQQPCNSVKETEAREYQKQNMFYSAIRFIYDVKTGPFWEHSPTLYNISGIQAGWSKINKGLVKMYDAEVLSKFPVIQHFPFGSLFAWEKDPSASSLPSSVHAGHQPKSTPTYTPSTSDSGSPQTQAPWSSSRTQAPSVGGTAAPWSQTQQSERNAARSGAIGTQTSRNAPLAGRQPSTSTATSVGGAMPP